MFDNDTGSNGLTEGGIGVAVADDRGVGPAPEFERQPPQDIQAEQSVLGGMLLSKDAIADVVEVLRSADFYRPAHQIVYDTILDLYGRGEPADPVTVSAELTRSGQLMRVGGATYLHTLISSVPTAANAGYYAEIVGERAVLRRLVEAGTRIVQLGYGAAAGQGGDVNEVVDRAQAEIYDVTERRMSEDYVRLEQLLQGTMDEIDAISSRGGASVGVPTGFAELDQITNGLHAGQMVVVAARPAIGKALALETPLPTPTGWTTMGDVRVGDRLLGADGRPTTIVAATDVMHGRACYEVEFSDGSVIVADALHQWRTTSRASRRAATERRPATHYRAPDRLGRVAVVASVAAEQDQRVTVPGFVSEVGAEFRNVIHTAARPVDVAGREARTSSGPRRTYAWHAPVYSRRQLAQVLNDRVSRPVDVWHAADHAEIVTTENIRATLRCASADQRPNHAVAVAAPLDLPDADLPIDPYLLGAWLGDGHSNGPRITSADPEIPDEIRRRGYVVKNAGRLLYSIALPPPPPLPERQCPVCGESFTPQALGVQTCGRSCGAGFRATGGLGREYRCRLCAGPAPGGQMCMACRSGPGTVTGRLRGLGVLGDKHIPPMYLRASEAQRRDLLAGLLDTDGYVSVAGSVQFAVTNQRLAEGAHELALSLGYRARMTTKPVPGRTPDSSTCYLVTFTPTEPVFKLSRKAERCRTSSRTTKVRYITDVRPVASVPVRCVEVDNVDHLYLAGQSMIPTHNSTLGLDFARSCSIKHGLTSVIFSLEMSRSEITMRLLSAEAKVALHHMRSGHMSDDDWARLARRMGEVADAPLYIDDSPNLTMMEIRAKARRLRQRNDLRLVVIDYLQLMTSGKRVESRQQEVSEFSRSLKLLAKELEVPVVGISQLNRGPEQRQDKKPMLSDLRESGCLTRDTTLLRADTGAPVSFETLLRDGWEGVSVWSMDAHRRLVAAPLTNVFSAGVKETFRLTLASGRTVKASANHKFLTLAGWRALSDITAGDRIAVPRRVPAPSSAGLGWSVHRVGLLAHLIGDGCVLARQPPHYTSQDEENLAFVEAAAAAEFGITPRRVRQGNWSHTYLPAPYPLTHGRCNPVHQWFRDLGISDLRSYEKRLPDALYAADDEEIRVFLRHLWATDGCVFVPATASRKSSARVYYSTSSRALADGVAHLLGRLGLASRTRRVDFRRSARPGYHVTVAGSRDMRRFCAEVGVHGARGRSAAVYLLASASVVVNTNVDTLPAEVWRSVRSARIRAGLTERQFQAAIGTHYCGSALYRSAPSRDRLLRCAEAVGSDLLQVAATDDAFWDQVVAVEPLGPLPVFDATVQGTHNFIADGIVAHNSIEQDADMVLLLHREDAYERESPRAGEADLILAKHRNGPTGVVTVAFQGHYSRFVDMAT